MAVGQTAPAAEEVKLSISGAALPALLHRCGAATADCDGLLFGRAARPPALPPSLSDYDDHAPELSAPPMSITVSGHSSLSQPSSLTNPLGRFHPLPPSSPPPLGFFSSRRRAPLRPSMRELSLACSLSKALQPLAHPLIFILVSPSASRDLSTHSFDYRAYLLRGSRLVPSSLTVVNVGPGFRDQYHTFAPQSPFPLLPPQAPQGGDGHSIGEQKAVDAMVEGFGLGRLQELVRAAAGQAAEMDGMYAGMLRRLEKLAKEVEKSNHSVLDQEKRNVLLRHRSAGLV
ncbi:uncharacterized protein [Lolium perenne]|uniref:uncharacterized protein n=1 Tax=Lolium perenne TaxID=4522 RepID=UPI0021F60B86|nr:uncharacterized protein LOC127294956 [Lolium perenne]XP_051180833.1 uncharacterized protein LOC127294956 [Lolium perenne]